MVLIQKKGNTLDDQIAAGKVNARGQSLSTASDGASGTPAAPPPAPGDNPRDYTTANGTHVWVSTPEPEKAVVDTTYQLQPGETIPAYNARVAAYNAAGGANTNTSTHGATQTSTTSGGDSGSFYDQQQNTISDAQSKLDDVYSAYQKEASRVAKQIKDISMGIIPLSAGEQAQVDALSNSYQQLIQQQQLQNTNAQGVANIRGYQTGSAEYDPTFQAKTIGSIVSAGLMKVGDLNAQMAGAVAKMTAAFQADDIQAVKDGFDIYSNAADKRTEALQKTIDEANEQIKAAQAAQQKVQDSIDDITKEAAENGADAATISQIKSAGSVGDAVQAAGGYLQKLTGDIGEYASYVKLAQSKGQTPLDYFNYLAAKHSATTTPTGGAGSLKPLTQSQANDFLYAQRSSQSNDIIGSLTGAVISMDPLLYKAQTSLESTGVGSAFVSDDVRQIRQAQRNFITAVLRRESGASISPTEFDTAEKQYFPMPGDDPGTIAQKAMARATVISSLKSNVPDYSERLANSADSILTSGEEVAESNVQQYGSDHPEAQSQIEEMVANGVPYATIQQTLGI